MNDEYTAQLKRIENLLTAILHEMELMRRAVEELPGGIAREIG